MRIPKGKQERPYLKNFEKLPTTTETLSFRVPMGERERLRALFASQGMTLTEGLKTAVYEFSRRLGG